MTSDLSNGFYDLREDGVWWITPHGVADDYIGKTVSILYNENNYVVINHGSPETVLKFASILNPPAWKIVEITIRGPFEVERLNNIIGTPGYLKTLLSGELVEQL